MTSRYKRERVKSLGKGITSSQRRRQKMPFDYSEMIQARNILLTVSLKGTGTAPIAYRLAQILAADIEEAEMDGANR